jgi:hypothetical protein
MAMKSTLGLVVAQPEVAKQTQKIAVRILMAATDHPPTAATPQEKAFHPPRLAKLSNNLGLLKGHFSSRSAVKTLIILFCR